MLVAVGASALPALAQQVCDERSYPLSSPTARFHDNADGTVTDTVSKLMWMRCSVGQAWSPAGACTGQAQHHNWQSAQAAAAAVNRDGKFFYNDWRLPQLRELATITERQCENPRVNLTAFPNTPPAAYWTVSSRPSAPPAMAEAFAFTLSFGAAGMAYSDKQEAMHVRLVRSAQ